MGFELRMAVMFHVVVFWDMTRLFWHMTVKLWNNTVYTFYPRRRGRTSSDSGTYLPDYTVS
jgi:hypothetical protein